jgi:hypothetical protein
VIKPFVGKLVGLGPNLVEVSAEFVPGNSGSPIVHLKSGKVIGVATYLTVREMDSLTGRRIPKVRRFGFRLESVKQWQPVVWQIYGNEFRSMQDIEARTQALATLLKELGRTGGITAARYQIPAIRRPLEKFDEVTTRRILTAPERTRAIKDLMASMRTACQSDIEQASTSFRYDFFRQSYAEEQKVRGEFHRIFDGMIKATGK